MKTIWRIVLSCGPVLGFQNLQTASLEFCIHTHASSTTLLGEKFASPLSRSSVEDRPQPASVLHFACNHSHFNSHPEAGASMPHPVAYHRLSCPCALEKRKCSNKQLEGSIISAASMSLRSWQTLPEPYRDHVCFYHCNATLKNCFS